MYVATKSPFIHTFISQLAWKKEKETRELTEDAGLLLKKKKRKRMLRLNSHRSTYPGSPSFTSRKGNFHLKLTNSKPKGQKERKKRKEKVLLVAQRTLFFIPKCHRQPASFMKQDPTNNVR